MDDDLLVGRYQRVRPLGSGGMGDVWLADDLELGRPVAVKRLRFGGPAGLEAELVERMLREARVVARLKHPAIVTLHDLVRVDGRPHLIMEYVEGESLADRIAREGGLPWRDVAAVVSDVAGALAAAHRAGVLHRDVKPANVLLDGDGHAHLADFGIARGAEDAVITQQGELVGTVAYMPPEIARNQEATPASDVWSLGATFFAAVEGAAPFADSSSSAPAIIARLISDDAPPPRRAGLCSDLLSRMLETEPARRPYAVAVVAEVAELLATPPAPETREAWLPVDAAPHQALPPDPARRRRWPALAALTLAALSLAVVLIGGYLLLRGDETAPPEPREGFAPVDVGPDPSRAELAPDGTAYVASRGDDVVMAIRSSGDAREFAVCDRPGAVTVASDGSFVYVPCAEGVVSVIDARTEEVLDAVDVGGVPGGLRLSDDDTLLFVPVDGGTIVVVDTATRTVTDRLEVGPAPELVQLSPDGSRGYSPDRDDGSVVVLDTRGPEVVGSIDVPDANGVQVTADGERLLVTADEGRELHIIDAASEIEQEVVELGGPTQGRVRIDPDDGFAWVPDTRGTAVSVVDLRSGQVRQVDLGSAPGSIVVFDSTGDTAYVATPDTREVAVIDTTTYRVSRVPVDNAPRALAITADDSLLYVVGDDPDSSGGSVTAIPTP